MAYIEERILPAEAGKKPKKVYRARIRFKGKPEVSDTFNSKSKAIAWAKKMEDSIREGRLLPRKEDLERTFGNLIERYIENELPKKPKSLAKQKMQLLWWKSHLGSYFLNHITPALIIEVRDKLFHGLSRRGKPRSTSTANRYLAALTHVYTIAVKEWGWCSENIALKIRRSKEGKARDRFLEKEEISRLLSACKKSKSPYLYPIVLIALTTCARKGEILSLKWRDIQFDRRKMTFRDTKNGETRSVALSDVVIDCLRKEQSKRIVTSEYVFPSLDGTKPADFMTSWKKVIKGIGLNICFHTLRHTGASHLAMNGATPLEIAPILGHKTLAMVKRYSHLSTSSTAQALNKMNQYILEEENDE
ncbi:tyrosine-type recombinase/integrase [Parachlamydia acanthamoebae]|uniref:tyrosine-type recombinase/integrase n=1 Tax=Parachlamydia acanthamoebae TaxID=83552 RepID=UPI000750A909|nr:site-specific integrase [Parachlamydia acanthamoebae]